MENPKKIELSIEQAPLSKEAIESLVARFGMKSARPWLLLTSCFGSLGFAPFAINYMPIEVLIAIYALIFTVTLLWIKKTGGFRQKDKPVLVISGIKKPAEYIVEDFADPVNASANQSLLKNDDPVVQDYIARVKEHRELLYIDVVLVDYYLASTKA